MPRTAYALAPLLAGALTACQPEEVEVKVFTFSEPVSAVEFDVDRGDVEIRAGEGDGITITRTLRFTSQLPRSAIDATAGVLRLEGSCPPIFLGSCSVDYAVTLPAGVSVRGALGAGDI